MSTAQDQLQVLTEFERALANITTVADGKKLRDEAEAFRYYAKTAKKGIAAQNRCATLRYLAERRVGELLAAMPRGHGPGRGKKNQVAPKSFLKVLKVEGIAYDDAQTWQRYAKVPEPAFRKWLADVCANDEDEIDGMRVAFFVGSYIEDHPTPAEQAKAARNQAAAEKRRATLEATAARRAEELREAARRDAELREAARRLRQKFHLDEEPPSVRQFIDNLRKKHLPWAKTLGDTVKPSMSPEAGRFIARIYRELAAVLTAKADQYEAEYAVSEDAVTK